MSNGKNLDNKSNIKFDKKQDMNNKMQNNDEFVEKIDFEDEDLNFEGEINFNSTQEHDVKFKSIKELNQKSVNEDTKNDDKNNSLKDNASDINPMVSKENSYDNNIERNNQSDNLNNSIFSNETEDIPQDNRTLKEKAKDARQNIKDTANKIKNAPKDIKNKIHDTKDKIKNTSDKIKDAPNKLKEKKDKLKDSWNNRPKNLKDVKDRIKNGDLKDKLKNRVKNSAKNVAKNVADNAKEQIKNSDVVQKAQDLKNKYDKVKKGAKAAKKIGKLGLKAAKGLINLFISTLPWSAIVIGVLLLIILIVVIVTIFLAPGTGGSVNDNNNLSRFSEVDQKTLEKIRGYFSKYPNADGSLAMATVLYPYFNILHNGNVTSYLYDTTDEVPEEVDETEIIDDEIDGDSEDLEDEKNGLEQNDMYLEPLRKYTVRKKLKSILKELNDSSKEEFNSYLKEKYFKKDKGYFGFDGDGYNGYKEMFDSVDSDKRDAFSDAIIEDLYEIKDMFVDYVFENTVCTSSSISLGFSDGKGIIKGEPVVVLKDTTSANYSTIKNAKSLYGTDTTPMPLGRYIMGVAYAEIGEYTKLEANAKAIMIAAKSFLLGRSQPAGKDTIGMGFTPDYTDTNTIFYIRANPNDQDFCDIYEGCEGDGIYSKKNRQNWTYENYKPALSSTDIANLEKWWNETAQEYIYDEDNQVFEGRYCSDYGVCSFCKQGSCLAQNKAYYSAKNGNNYKTILFGSNGAYSDSRFVLFTGDPVSGGGSLSKVSVNCVGVTGGGCTIPDDKFIYYSQRSYNDPNKDKFCGKNTTISDSGCGTTSMAMIIANLTNETSITPINTTQEAFEGGYCGEGIYGTSSGYFQAAAKKYGLTLEIVSSGDTSEEADKKILDTLKSGGLIIANVGNNWSSVQSGHYLVIKGITADNKLIIADPMTYPTGSTIDTLKNPWKNYLTIEEMRSYMLPHETRNFFLFTGGKSEEIKDNYCKTGNGVATGYLGNPLDPNDTTKDFSNEGNARSFPRYNGGGCHGAIDLTSVASGTPVYAMDGGVISSTTEKDTNCYDSCCGVNDSYGISVTIDHGNGYKTVYAHLSLKLVNNGDKVSKGQLIGYSGNTGCSTGAHLHLELQNTAKLRNRNIAKCNSGNGLMNPADYINKTETYVGKTR